MQLALALTFCILGVAWLIWFEELIEDFPRYREIRSNYKVKRTYWLSFFGTNITLGLILALFTFGWIYWLSNHVR